MKALVGVAGACLVIVIAWDAFEAMVLPRRVTRRFRPTRFFYRSTWRLWGLVARAMRGGRRETYLSFYGPLSLLLLIALWAASLVVGFAMIHWGLDLRLNVPYGPPTFAAALYLSGETFFTLGLGDVTPSSAVTRALTVVEAGVGFGFLALFISYLPVLYQSFSRREVTISLLDARAGSPPTAAELLRRHARDIDGLAGLLHEWERWSAELLESHLSYPVLTYFRSQHDNQSWLAALTAVLDASALVMTSVKGAVAQQAQLTFAIARHAVVDLAQVFGTPPRRPGRDRLPPDVLARLRATLADAGVALEAGSGADQTLAELRAMYEPYVEALARHLLLTLPDWDVDTPRADNWRTSAWERAVARARALSLVDVHDDDA